MIWGCSYELFWTLNPKKLKAFEKAYTEKIEQENKVMDVMAWRIGAYVTRSIGAALDGRRSKYPEMPEMLRPSPEVEEAQRIRAYMENHSRYMRELKRNRQSAKTHTP